MTDRSTASTLFMRLWRKTIRMPSGCWEWQGYVMPKEGYGQIGTGAGIELTHRVAWKLANNKAIPDGLKVRHTCDNRPCVNPAHLELGTQADNVQDAIDRGRIATGFSLPQTKLSPDDVRAIRRRYGRIPTPSGERGWRTNRSALAAEFNVHPQYITDIVRKKERADVQ